MSSHKNKAIRERLERIYGKGCMFQKAHIAQRIEEIGGIKTYKQYIQQHKYSFKKVKKLEETMTLHHLKHRADDRTYFRTKWCSNKCFGTRILTQPTKK